MMVDTKESRYNLVYKSHLGDHCQQECMSTYSVKGKNPYNLEVRSRNYLAIEERRRLLGYVTKID